MHSDPTIISSTIKIQKLCLGFITRKRFASLLNMSKKRKQIAEEIVSTEEDYLNALILCHVV